MKINDNIIYEKTEEAKLKSNSGNFKEAEKILMDLLKTIKGATLFQAGIILKLAHNAENQGDDTKVIYYCDFLLNLYSGNRLEFHKMRELYDLLGTNLIIKAGAHIRLKEFQSAVDAYNNIIDLFKNATNDVELYNLLFSYHGLGNLQAAHSQSKPEGSKERIRLLRMARSNFKKVLQIDSEYFPAYTHLGLVYWQLGDSEKSELMYEKAISIPIRKEKKKFPEDNIVYQYRRFDEYCLKNIISGKIFLNNPKNFNDPFDCPVFRGNNYRKNPSFSHVIDKVRITCFSKTKDSILLWSHYADSHKGICIGYRINEKYIINNNLHFGEIIYQEQNLIKKSINEFKGLLNDTFFIKNKVWKYENECRLIGYDLESSSLPAPEIESITFGIDFPESDRKVIRQIFKDRNDIKIYKVIQNDEDLINMIIEKI